MDNRPHEELAQIARDLLHGHIFTDRHLNEDPHLLPSVFMVLGLLDAEHIAELQADPPGLIFEYLREAFERGVNGYPCFFSVQMLSQDDTQKVFEMIRKLEAAEKEALQA